jgi:hypothetical protein
MHGMYKHLPHFQDQLLLLFPDRLLLVKDHSYLVHVLRVQVVPEENRDLSIQLNHELDNTMNLG